MCEHVFCLFMHTLVSGDLSQSWRSQRRGEYERGTPSHLLGGGGGGCMRGVSPLILGWGGGGV